MGKFITLLFLIVLSLGVKSQVPSVKGQDDATKMYPVNYEMPGKKAIKLNSTTVLLDTDKDNLLVNGSFEAQTATQGWSLTSLASSTASTSDVFDGKKKVCLSGIGSIFQMLSDTDKYHGRKFIARFNIQNPQGREGRACIYDGEDLHKCVQIQKSDDFVEYVTGDTFIKGKSYGVIVNSLELDDICVDAVSVKLDANEAFVAEIEGDYQQVVLYSSTALAANTDLGSLTQSRSQGNSSLFSLSASGVTVLRDVEMSIFANVFNSSHTTLGLDIRLNGVIISSSVSRAGTKTQVGTTGGLDLFLSAGDKITFESGSNTRAYIQILAKARSQVVVYPDETFSTDINPVYWKATPCGDDEIGCYNTYEYAANSNAGTICSTRPTQSDADIRVNGFNVTLRQKISDPASCASAPRIEMVVPKNSFYRHTVYKDTSRSAFSDGKLFAQSASSLIGFRTIEGNPETGRFIIDSGAIFGGGDITLNRINYSDNSATTSGYVVVKASKTGASLVDERDKVKSSADNVRSESCKINNDGTASIDSSSGLCESWVQSVSRVALGVINVTFKPGVFSSNPVCIGSSGYSSNFSTNVSVGTINMPTIYPTTQAVTILTRKDTSTASSNFDLPASISCRGKR